MTLSTEIEIAAREIVTDSYQMSVGELISLYRDGEMIINPDFQRYFRWEHGQKTKFIESLLLGIPIPPIFVFQLPEGNWELVDGLQRLSTLFEFVGVLRRPDEDGVCYEPLRLGATKMLPALFNKLWEADDEANSFTQTERLRVKRARIQVEILKAGSDPKSKYELFNRLNSTGSHLSEQEIRNCTLMMVNKPFFEWLEALSKDQGFSATTKFTDNEFEKRKDLEWVTRFFVYRNVPFERGLDVHEYLDEGGLLMATNTSFDRLAEEDNFKRTFGLLARTLSDGAFKKFDGNQFSGKVLISAFEMVAIGVSQNLRSWERKTPEELTEKVKLLWNDNVFLANSGAGASGTYRILNLLRYAPEFFSV